MIPKVDPVWFEEGHSEELELEFVEEFTRWSSGFASMRMAWNQSIFVNKTMVPVLEEAAHPRFA